ncbi:MAG: efflux RND transporter periplasmic adaptor subunit [Myxococcota bacterium]|nr:efflux RND transporter periplasmic adaptor subunit [Myxococcota bacterium]
MYIQQNRRTLLLAVLILLAAAGGLGLRRTDSPAADAAPMRILAVRAEPVAAAARYERERSFVGRIEFAQTAALSFELGGRVERLHVDEGDRVEAGAVLAELDTERLRARRAELVSARDEARALLDLAALRDQRARKLLDEDVISPQAADDTRLERSARAASLARVEAQIASIDVDLAKALLRAPFAGEIAARRVDPGVVVDSGHPVLRLLETARPEARVGVPRAVALGLRAGEVHRLRIGDVSHPATVLAVLPERQGTTRTVAVRLRVGGATDALHEGDLAELVLAESVAEAGLWLPRAALTEGARGLWTVYVASADARDGFRLERRPLELLHEAGDRVYVRGALRDGELVVQDGVHRLVPGQRVRIADEGWNVARSEAH